MSSEWSGRRAVEALAKVRARGRRLGSPCVICLQPIDYQLPSTDPGGVSVEHIKARSTHPHLIWDPTNWAPAHLRCNQAKGVEPARPSAEPSEAW